MKKMIAGFALVLASSLTFAADQAVIDRYNKSCTVCHATGVANAPKFGVANDWKPRLDKGIDKLVLSVKSGLNAMPPRGLCLDCTDADYTALIQYMSAPKK